MTKLSDYISGGKRIVEGHTFDPDIWKSSRLSATRPSATTTGTVTSAHHAAEGVDRPQPALLLLRI